MFSKSGGNLGETGCVGWLFERKGIILVDKNLIKDEETFMLEVIDSGAEDIVEVDSIYEISTSPAEFMNVRKGLSTNKIDVKSAEVTYVPKSSVEVSKKEADRVLRMINTLEDHDDIQNVYSNVEIPDDYFQDED